MAETTLTLSLGILLILIGVAAALAILEIIGKQDVDPERAAPFRVTHKVLGYIFFILFLIISVLMFMRLKYWPGEIETRVVFHWALAVVVIALLIAKIVINRRYEKMYNLREGLLKARCALSFDQQCG